MSEIREHIRLSAGEVDGELGVVVIRAGAANGLLFPAGVLARSAAAFEGAPCFVDHAGPLDAGRAGGRSVRDLAGYLRGVRWDEGRQAILGRLRLVSQAAWVGALARELGDEPFFGLSADMWVRREGKEVRAIESVHSVDVVVNPAAGGRFLGSSSEHRKEASEMRTEGEVQRVQVAEEYTPRCDDCEPSGQGAADLGPGAERLSQEVQALRTELMETKLAHSGLPAPLVEAVRAQFRGHTPSSAELDEEIARFRSAWAQALTGATIKGLGEVQGMVTPLEKVTLAFERLMGLPETAAHRAVARLTGIRELYDLLTGDWERHGLFRPERVTLANVTTTTMTSVVANVLNKVLLRAFESRPQWWRPIAYEEDFQTLNTVRWITLGGFGDLDTVAEGGSYTEKSWDDAAETADFVKKGNYIGITLEMIDRDDVAAVRSIPRRLGLAAYRTLSAAVAALFTANGGVGPTLSDGKALFHADHGNLGTASLDADSWDAVIQAMWKQTELNSSKRLGIRPRYCLVPIELEKTALTIFESDLEPGTDTNDANVRRNSSSVITVPEWTDASDWAAAADPGDLEGVCIGYRFGRAPEIFVADSDVAGSMFTNDEMRIKVRFIYAVGIGNFRALYKNNVA